MMRCSDFVHESVCMLLIIDGSWNRAMGTRELKHYP